MTICQNCQTPNPDGARYCQRCGQPLMVAAATAVPETQAPTSPASPASPAPSFGPPPNVVYATPSITPAYMAPSSSLPKSRDIPISSTGTKYATVAGAIAVIAFFALPYVSLGIGSATGVQVAGL